MKTLKIVILSIAMMPAYWANAQLNLTGTNYLQNFDALADGLPPGWFVLTNASTTSLGNGALFSTASRTWSDTTGGFGNCASTVGNGGEDFIGSESGALQGNCTNRALAIRQTGSFGDPGAGFVLNLTNTLGMANFQLSLDLLMLSVQTRSTIWTVDYAVGNAPVNFTPLVTYDDPGVFGATHTNFSFGTALDNQNANVWIRVTALNASTGSGSRDTFGLDNFLLSWMNISTTSQPMIAGITIVDGRVQIDFSGADNDLPESFLLVGASQVDGGYADTGAVMSQRGTGEFQADCPISDTQQFYRILRQ